MFETGRVFLKVGVNFRQLFSLYIQKLDEMARFLNVIQKMDTLLPFEDSLFQYLNVHCT
jgi:DNA-binding transcriptional regulator WhiA